MPNSVWNTVNFAGIGPLECPYCFHIFKVLASRDVITTHDGAQKWVCPLCGWEIVLSGPIPSTNLFERRNENGYR